MKETDKNLTNLKGFEVVKNVFFMLLKVKKKSENDVIMQRHHTGHLTLHILVSHIGHLTVQILGTSAHILGISHMVSRTA